MLSSPPASRSPPEPSGTGPVPPPYWTAAGIISHLLSSQLNSHGSASQPTLWLLVLILLSPLPGHLRLPKDTLKAPTILTTKLQKLSDQAQQKDLLSFWARYSGFYFVFRGS